LKQFHILCCNEILLSDKRYHLSKSLYAPDAGIYQKVD